MWKVDKGSLTGVTTVAYVSALDWKVAELGRKTILLKNTHASQSLKYKLSGYAVDGGIGKELVAETVLSAGEIAEFCAQVLGWLRTIEQFVLPAS